MVFRPLNAAVGAVFAVGTLFAFAAQAEPPSIGDWEDLMKDTGTEPIVITPTSSTQAVVNERRYAWLRIQLEGPAMESLKGSPDEAGLKPLLEQIARRLSGLDEASADPAAVEKMAAFAKRQARQPRVDYLLAAGLIAARKYDDALPLFRAVAEAPPEAPPGQLFRLVAQGYVFKDAEDFKHGDKDAAERRFFEIFAAQVDEPLDADGLLCTVLEHLAYPLNSVRFGREAHYIELYNASQLPEWARLTCVGAAEAQTAWREQHRGMMPTNEEEGKRVNEAIVRAKAAFTRAWKLKPDVPYAAWEMIVLGRMSGAKRAELRQWLDRSVAAQCDYLSAYQDFLNAISPAYGGDFGGMLAFGRACAETGRYDTQIPTFFNETVNRIGRESADWRALYRQPGISALLLEARRRRAEKVAGTPEENLEESQLALESWLTGDYALAATALNKIRGSDGVPLGNGNTVDAAARLYVPLAFVFRDALLRGGPARAEYEQAADLLSAGKPAEAEAHFQKALPDADGYSRKLIEADLKLVEFQKAYAGGDWTPLPLSERLCWTQHTGDAFWQADSKRLRLTAPLEFGKTLFRGNLGPNFELRGHFFSSRNNQPKAAGFAIHFGHSPEGMGDRTVWGWTMRVDPKDDQHYWVHYAGGYSAQREEDRKVRDWTDDNPFRFRYQEGKISYFAGDRELIHGAETSSDLPSGENAVGFGILGHGAGSYAEIWDWDAKRIEPEK